MHWLFISETGSSWYKVKWNIQMPLLKTPVKHLPQSKLQVKQEHWPKETSIILETDEENYFPWK